MFALSRTENTSISQARTYEVISSSVDLIGKVAQGVFSAIAEHAQEALPSFVIMAVQVFYPASFFFLTNVGFVFFQAMSVPFSLFLLVTSPPKDASELCRSAQMLATTAVIAELALNLFFPPSIVIRVAVQGTVITASLLGNMNSIRKGIEECKKALSDYNREELSKKVSRVVYSLISVGLGIYGTVFTFQLGARFYRGVKKFQTLNPIQQKFALKYHAIENLGETKLKKAVIIDGFNGDWAEKGNYFFDNQPDPIGLVIYNNYETRTYQVNSSEELGAVLEQAKKELGQEVDLLSFCGHSNASCMRLGPNYFFTGTGNELFSIRKTVRPSGEICLWGCQTDGRGKFGMVSLARYISKQLPKHLVTGFSGDLFPAMSSCSFDGKNLQIKVWSYEGFDVVRKYLNGNLIAITA